jgi:hypothetical protein
MPRGGPILRQRQHETQRESSRGAHPLTKMKRILNKENMTAVAVVIVALVIWQFVGSTLTGWITKAKDKVTA